jgi:phosphonate transport system substrate-binding protein
MRVEVARGGVRARFVGAAVVLLAGCGEVPDTVSRPQAVAHAAVDHLVFGGALYKEGDDGASVRPLTTYLARRMGIRVDLRMGEPYRELPTLLREGSVDVALLPPLAYVQAREQLPQIRPLATGVVSGNPTYLGHLYVKDDSRFRTLADLRGARVGYVAPASTSGFLFPRDLLRQKGYDPDAFFGSSVFLGSHPRVLQAVLAGEIDVGAAEDVTTDWLGSHGRPAGLRVVAKTERIPEDCMAARPGLDEQTAGALVEALLELGPGVPQASAIAESMGINGWLAGDDRRYDRVREVLAHENARRRRAPEPSP